MLDIQKAIGAPKIVETVKDDLTSSFEIRNLPRGFGHTLGNALRRIMLGYTLGGSVTAVKIKGVAHEYMVVDGVKESIVDFMLNLKELRFTLDEVVTGEQFVPQKFSGVGKYTAADLKFPSGMKLLNPEVYLIEITDPSVELVFDLRVEKGYGYYSLDYLRSREKKTSASDTNMILIDNDFRLVEYVKYDVEQVIEDFSGSTKDHLHVEIKMLYKGVTPKQFLAFAGEILASYAKILIYDDIYIDRSVLVEFEEISGGKEKLSEETNVKTMPIDALPLSERTRNALIKNKILYVEDLEKQKKNELLLMKGVGRKAVDEISVALGNIGKSLIG